MSNKERCIRELVVGNGLSELMNQYSITELNGIWMNAFYLAIST